jgi:hypothetical protein
MFKARHDTSEAVGETCSNWALSTFAERSGSRESVHRLAYGCDVHRSTHVEKRCVGAAG